MHEYMRKKWNSPMAPPQVCGFRIVEIYSSRGRLKIIIVRKPHRKIISPENNYPKTASPHVTKSLLMASATTETGIKRIGAE
jgi:hypothetical protein